MRVEGLFSISLWLRPISSISMGQTSEARRYSSSSPSGVRPKRAERMIWRWLLSDALRKGQEQGQQAYLFPDALIKLEEQRDFLAGPLTVEERQRRYELDFAFRETEQFRIADQIWLGARCGSQRK